MFRLKWVNNVPERTFGIMVRLFGIDISALFLFWLNDWRLIDLRIPCNWGIFLQVGFVLLSVGRLSDDTIYDSEGT